ncbi:MAG TPA: cytochrome c peroxidase [Kofleriaceae bacterium]
MKKLVWAAPVAVIGGAMLGMAARAAVPKEGALGKPVTTPQVGFPTALFDATTPKDNPNSPDKVALGEKLFFDARLSADGTVSCATCHDPDKGFTDQLPTSVGIKNQKGQRNAPTVLGAALNDVQFWDGRAAKLEDQAKLPILNPIEMGQKTGNDVVAALAKTEYAAEFQKVFARALNYDDVGRAIAAYERTQVATASRFDKFIAGDEKVLNAQERRGWALFNGKGRCMSCHPFNPTQPTFSDNKFHNIGVSAHKSNFPELAKKGLKLVNSGDATAIDRAALETDMSELGRFLVTKQEKDIGNFKTPTLRNLLVTEPYFHDGSQATLWDVVDHYNKGGVQNPFLDGGVVKLGLSEAEIDDLVAFLATLTTDRYEALAQKQLAKQRGLSRTKRPQRDTAAVQGKTPGLTGPFGDVAPTLNDKDKNPSRVGGR